MANGTYIGSGRVRLPEDLVGMTEAEIVDAIEDDESPIGSALRDLIAAETA